MTENQSAGKPKRARSESTKRQDAKSTGSAKKADVKTLRIQLHIEEQTVERLRVHTALSHRNDSAVVGEILLSWLARFGKGRELFPVLKKPGEDLGELFDSREDRQSEAAA